MASPLLRHFTAETANAYPTPSPAIFGFFVDAGGAEDTPLLLHFTAETANAYPIPSPAINSFSVDAGGLEDSPFLLNFSAETSNAYPIPSPSLGSFFTDVMLEEAENRPRLRVVSLEAYSFPGFDYLPPGLPTYGTIEGEQVNGDPKGRTQVTLNFSAPLKTQQIGGEYLGDATGVAQALVVDYSPISAAPDVSIYEVTGYTGGGGDTLLSLASSIGEFRIEVVNPANFPANSWLEVKEGALREYAQVLSVAGPVVTLYNPLIEAAFTTAATVKSVDVTLKTITTDYTLNLGSGGVHLVSGQFTATNPVFARYQAELLDLDHFELYRVPGNMPYPDGASYADVTGDAGVVLVDDDVSATATSAQDTVGSANAGEIWTYYFFAKDTDGNFSRAQAVMVETMISIIQNLSKTTGPGKVVLSWDAPLEPLYDGLNVYRCDGAFFNPATAVKVNTTLVTGTSFTDGVENVTNRRPPGEVPYPLGGVTYTYSVEAVDDASDWDTGTQNQAADPLQSEVLTATKTD